MTIVVDVFRGVGDWFWTESFWLPSNHTWAGQAVQTKDVYYPNATDLWVPFPLALALFLVRLTWER